MITHRISQGWSNGGNGLSRTREISAGAENNLDESIAAGAVNQLVAFVLDVSQLKALYLLAAAALTIKTNSSGAPANTFVLQPGVPFVWHDQMPALRDTAGVAVGTDITALYVSNAGADAVVLQLRSLLDPTV